MPIIRSLHTINFVNGDRPWDNDHLESIIAAAAGYGVSSLEVVLFREINLQRVRTLGERHGLSLICGVVLPEEFDTTSDDAEVRRAGTDYLIWCVEAAYQLGASLVAGVIHSWCGKIVPARPSERHYMWSAQALRAAADRASAYGVELAVEPVNRYESSLINTVEQAVELLGKVDRPNVGVMLDTFHANLEERSWREALTAARGHLKHVHLCESNRGILGQGLIDWEEFFSALQEIGYEGPAALESFVELPSSPRSYAPSNEVLVRESLQYLRAMEALQHM